MGKFPHILLTIETRMFYANCDHLPTSTDKVGGFNKYLINKKCAAEATHEKYITPFAATQLRQFIRECEIRACIFTNR